MPLADQDATPDSAVLRDEAFPTVDRRFGENSPRLLVAHTWMQTQRLLIRLARDPMTFVFGLALPIFFLVVKPINYLIELSHHEDSPDPTTRKCPECLS